MKFYYVCTCISATPRRTQLCPTTHITPSRPRPWAHGTHVLNSAAPGTLLLRGAAGVQSSLTDSASVTGGWVLYKAMPVSAVEQCESVLTIHIYTRMHVCTHTLPLKPPYIYTHTYACVYTHPVPLKPPIYIYIYIRMHACTCTPSAS